MITGPDTTEVKNDSLVSVKQIGDENQKMEIWNFLLNSFSSEPTITDPEQESKILRYPPTEILRCSWYLNKNILTVHINCNNLCSLRKLDQENLRKSDMGLERFLSIVKSCERLEEELLNIEPLFLHPDLIYFSSDAKILTLPFATNMVSAGSLCTQGKCGWIFPTSGSADHQISSLADLLHWISGHYLLGEEVVQELLPLCQENNYRKLYLILSGQGEFSQSRSPVSAVVSNSRDIIGAEDNAGLSKLHTSEELLNADKEQEDILHIGNTDKMRKNIDEYQSGNKKARGFFGSLLSRYSRDFQLSEKTVDLQLEDPFFRMACLSEGLPGTKEEKLGHRAFILVDEFLIGRDSDLVDFWIDSQSVSRQHACIRRRQGSFFLEDLGSRNSTLLDGKKVGKNKEYLLPDKCRLTFADRAYYFEANS